ncbi:MAG: SRPBCC family protein [Actinomycetes bacterium]
MSMWVETAERTIPASPEAIFALIADPTRHKDFDGSGTVRDATDVPATLTLGAKFGMHMEFGGKYTMENTVIEYEPNRRIAWQARPPRGKGGAWRQLFGGRIWRYELDPVAGGTRVRESWDVSKERNKWVVRAYGPKTRKNMAATLERIENVLASR